MQPPPLRGIRAHAFFKRIVLGAVPCVSTGICFAEKTPVADADICRGIQPLLLLQVKRGVLHSPHLHVAARLDTVTPARRADRQVAAQNVCVDFGHSISRHTRLL